METIYKYYGSLLGNITDIYDLAETPYFTFQELTAGRIKSYTPKIKCYIKDEEYEIINIYRSQSILILITGVIKVIINKKIIESINVDKFEFVFMKN